MYVIEGTNYPVIYIANYRVGSSATAATLLNMGARQINHHHGLPDTENLIEGALIVQGVRHHCDVVVSNYFTKAPTEKIDEYVRMICRGGHEYLRPPKLYDRYPCNYVLRFETLQFEFDMLCEIVGLPQTVLLVDPSRRPENTNWQDVLYRHMIDQIYDVFGEEMDFFGYGKTGNIPERIDGAV
jgi:hypothetical protein